MHFCVCRQLKRAWKGCCSSGHKWTHLSGKDDNKYRLFTLVNISQNRLLIFINEFYLRNSTPTATRIWMRRFVHKHIFYMDNLKQHFQLLFQYSFGFFLLQQFFLIQKVWKEKTRNSLHMFARRATHKFLKFGKANTRDTSAHRFIYLSFTIVRMRMLCR